CTPCGVNTYKVAGTSNTCSNCPTNSVSLAGSTALTSCKCRSGSWGGIGVACTQCLAGTSKPSADTAASLITSCGSCSVNTYSAVGASTCTGCPVNTVSLPGSMSCGCRGGYHGNLGGPCTACGAGTFKPSADTTSASNAASCTSCAEGYFSTDIGSISISSCTACPTTRTSPIVGTPPGCTACEYGKYKTNAGSSACVSCPYTHITESVGAIDVGSCQSCSRGMAADPNDRSRCVCDIGGTWVEANGDDPAGCAPCGTG
ncbi:hypothetical protein T484DRAFT_1564097, partial [Baffinella frigidus]